jgi:D-amino-acid oxidase
MRNDRKRILIVGGGVIGLTCAAVLGERHHVKVRARQFGSATESVKATAIWHVYLVPETERILGWAERTLSKLIEIQSQNKEAGIELITGVELFRTQPRKLPVWWRIPRVFEMLTDTEIERCNSHDGAAAGLDIELLARYPVIWGYRIQAPAARMETYLQWLTRHAESKAVAFEYGEVDNLETTEHNFEYVINCTGFGDRELVNDSGFSPYKGQYFVLDADADAPREYLGDDDFPGGMAYVIARGGQVMVGGTAEEGVEDFVPTIKWQSVVNRAGAYVPWLRTRQEQDTSRRLVVCVRPARSGGVRLEAQQLGDGRTLVHNYGHGGSGFSLSWGCAEEVLRLIEE